MGRKQKLAACLALILLCSVMPFSVQATEETREKIRRAEQEKKETESRLDQSEENLKDLNEQHSSLQGALSSLNTELT